jgi:hypothetical protein
MNIDAPEIRALRAKVRAADEEFYDALACHEAWKPAAYDKALHARIGRSYAGNTFLVLRQMLRRGMVLSLMHLWDTDKRAVGMGSIANALGDKRILAALTAEGAARFGKPHPSRLDHIEKAMGEDLRHSAAEAIAIIRKYEEGGSSHATFTKLKTWRDEHLAHRQINPKPIEASDQDTLDEAIEAFYQDMSMLIRLLLHVVEKTANDPEQTAEVYAHCATFFWASVCGERTKGHPQYRSPPARRNAL